ncbi:glycosyltransferase family 4 protein [Aurantimonas sp. VKM B-3413]|uniref:glycosyltransferase family 4 protein n=1 Tax=Aurantimonas sp. VKM B-3413 TaxID=2779401 RepID=UPI001E4AF175|nr:glycosyltransferase family 4 protein [Aurantimonas sp. VKM B-3413]
MSRRLVFAIPGDLATPSGGYAYDRRMMAELAALGWQVDHLGLPGQFPEPDAHAMASVAGQFGKLPDDALVMVDGLAFGAMPEIARHEAKRLRLVALVHHPLALETGISEAAAKHLATSERAALTAARAVVVTSPATAATLRRDYGVPQDRLNVILPGTDRPDPSSPTSAADGPPLILSVGSLIPRKDHATLVAALGALLDLDWHCRIVGSDIQGGGTAAELKRQIGELGLQSRVELTGAIRDLAAEYRAAAIFVLASHYEGFGMVFAEAMAHGLPIVACAKGAPEEFVPAEAGARFKPGDAAGLAAALRGLLADPERRALAAAASRKAGQALPNWPQSAAALSEILERLAA